MNVCDLLLLAFVCKSAENLYFCRSVVWPGEAFVGDLQIAAT